MTVNYVLIFCQKEINPETADCHRALDEIESELLSTVPLSVVLPQAAADQGGFMTRVERVSLLSEHIEDTQKMQKIIQLLRKKDIEAFDSFCRTLQKSGYLALVEKLRTSANRAPLPSTSADDAVEGMHELAPLYINIYHITSTFYFADRPRGRGPSVRTV